MAEEVPLVRQRSVQDSGTVAPYQNVDYSPEAFGAGIGRALVGIGQTGQQLAETQRRLEGDVKANDALTNIQKAKDELRPWMFDPNDGILAKTGGNAVGSGEQARVVTEDIKNRYLSSIKDPETRDAWSKMWDREAEQAKDQAARHELSQIGEYKAQTTKGILLSNMQDAYNNYNDPKAIQHSIDQTLTAIRANSLGLPQEMVDASAQDAVSSIHLAVISRWAQEDPSKAFDYYKEHKKEFTGKDHVTATQFLQPVMDERRAREWVAGITGQGGQATHDIYSAIEFAESGGQATAESPVGASGVMQLMPGTALYVAEKLGHRDIFAGMSEAQIKQKLKDDPTLNRQLGRAYFNEQLTTFHGDIEAALVAYNAGPEGAKAFLEHNAGNRPGERDYNVPGWKGIKNESEAYVKKVLGAYGGGRGPTAAPGTRMTRENWSLKNFQPDDLIAPTEGGAWVDAQAAQAFDDVVTQMKGIYPGFAAKVNEPHVPGGTTAGRRRGTSDPNDNPHVKKSQHLAGRAFDVQVQGWSDEQKATFLRLMRQAGFGGVGFYGPDGHLHLDRGSARTWGRMPGWARSAMQTPVVASGPAVTPPYGGAGGTGAAPGYQGSFYVGIQPPATSAWMEAAQGIADTGMRERVTSMLRVEAAQQESAMKLAEADLKTQAWQTVIQGSVADIKPEVLMKLDPGFVNTLSAYESNRAKGGVKNDDQAWANFNQMLPEELLATDVYTEYRNKFDDEHFDKAVAMKKAAADAQRGDQSAKNLLNGTRTAQQILSDAVAGMAGDKETFRAELSKNLDIRMEQEATAKGAPLKSSEIQDIVDKLLLTDQSLWRSKPAMRTEAPENFVAADDWEEVQDDDQRVLTQTYESFYRTAPSREEATDIYNRAFRVWLGAKPTGPKDEQAFFRQQLEARLSRQLTDLEFENYYGKWLLKFLGR